MLKLVTLFELVSLLPISDLPLAVLLCSEEVVSAFKLEYELLTFSSELYPDSEETVEGPDKSSLLSEPEQLENKQAIDSKAKTIGVNFRNIKLIYPDGSRTNRLPNRYQHRSW